MKDQQRNLGLLLTDAARLLRRRLEQEARSMPITVAQMRIVVRLAHNEGISQAALAALLEIEPMTLSRHIDRMAAAGLVERRHDPDDRRARQIFTTDRARRLLAPMRERADAVYAEVLEGLSPAQREALLDGLETIIAHLATPQSGAQSGAQDTAQGTEAAAARAASVRETT